MFQSSVCQSVSRQTYNLDLFFLIKSVEKVEHGSRKKLLISGSDRSRVDTGNYFHNSVAPAVSITLSIFNVTQLLLKYLDMCVHGVIYYF